MSRARDLSRLSNPTNFTADGTTGRVGLGSENPTAKLNVAGIVSATAFYGDGSNLEGVASAGLGTALAEDGAGSVIYYTDKVLGVATNITVDVPDASSSNVAYTQYEEISVDSGIDFIVADGDDFVPDILGISSDVQVPGILAGGGGRVRADNFSNKAGTGAPTFSTGINVTGVVTATTFSGALSGNATSATSATTATTATNAQGLTGTPNITIGNLVGVAATFTGVLTYEDVTNIDSLGIVTARTGVKVLAGGVNVVGGGITATGIGTFHSGLNTEDILAEEVNVTAGKLSDNTNIDVENGMVHLFTTTESTTSTPNIRYNASTSLNIRMSIGQSIVVTLITTANAFAYSAQMTIDGAVQTENWIGGSPPSDGGGSGVDIHTFTIIKTADATFTVIANHSKTS
jgi:hypothetical protein